MLTRFKRLAVLTRPRRFWVLTRPRRLFVETRPTKLGVLTRPTRFAVDTYPAEPSPITVEKRGPPIVFPLIEETVRLEPLKRPVRIEEKLPVCATVIVEKVLVPLLKLASDEMSCEEEMYPADPSPITVEKRGPPIVFPLMDDTTRLEPLKRPVRIEEKVPLCATVIVEKVLVPL